MKFAAIATLLTAVCVRAQESSPRLLKDKKKKDKCPGLDPQTESIFKTYDDYLKHYLVGLLNYPNANIPSALGGHSSGALLEDVENVPFNYIPNTGFSSIQPYYIWEEEEVTVKDKKGKETTEIVMVKKIVRGEFLVLSDNGYTTSDKSEDYALHFTHMKILKPFTYWHGDSTFESYTETENLGTYLISDPDKLIYWEGWHKEVLDIQVTYDAPADWGDLVNDRVLTGRDFNPEGFAVLHQNCSIVGDQYMPSIFAMDPRDGVVKSAWVRAPEVRVVNRTARTTAFVDFPKLTTVSDKSWCTLSALKQNDCKIVEDELIDDDKYWDRIDPDAGFGGLALLGDDSVAGFFSKPILEEDGVRVYKILPGDCSEDCAPTFDSFLGLYPLSKNADYVADISSIAGSDTRVVVIERNDFPDGHHFPAPVMPANKLCIVDITPSKTDDNFVFTNKKCILNYHHISDPWDVDNNGNGVYALSSRNPDALIVVDDYCFIAGTDTNFPFTNEFDLQPEQIPFYQHVMDTRFMIVCFLEPVFNKGYPIF